ncbi:MAG: hypothetical protein ACEQSB_00135 [Undibacterium sp.]
MRKFYKYEEDNELWAETQFGYLDAYQFGEGLLDGVIFKFSVSSKGDLQVQPAENSKDYFEKLNKQKWTKAAIKCAEESYSFASTEECRDDDVILYDRELQADQQNNPLRSRFEFKEEAKPSLGRSREHMRRARHVVEAFLEQNAPGFPDYTLIEDGEESYAFYVVPNDTTSYLHRDMSIEWYGTGWPNRFSYDEDTGDFREIADKI